VIARTTRCGRFVVGMTTETSGAVITQRWAKYETSPAR
jgi:hypothetical protein